MRRSIVALCACTLSLVGVAACGDRATPENAYLHAVRLHADFPDDDQTLLAIGQVACHEIETDGASQMRHNLAQSSFTQDQQAAIADAVMNDLCP